MSANKIIVALAFPIVVLLIWTLLLTAKVLFIDEVTVRIAGYDPRDLLAGHYIAYVIDWDNTDCTQFENNICPQKDFADNAINSYWGPQYRFYISEKYAPELDKLFRFNHQNHILEIIYKYTSGLKPIAVQLLIDGQPWQQTIINQQQR